MDQLAPERADEIKKALQRAGANRPCARCGNTKWILADGYFNSLLQLKFDGIYLGGPTIPSAVTVCDRCGLIAQHALGVLGLLPNQPDGEGEKK